MLPEEIMLKAVEIALNGRGRTAPNPCVGAILAQNGEIAACGYHSAYGRAHAEVEAIADARAKGVDPAGCDLYVTLEPCNHYGKTPPCSKAVLEAGIRRVFVGAIDPNPTVAGGGAGFLRAGGVEVQTGIAGDACLDLIEDFRTWKFTARTYNILKSAMTLDGKIATKTGDSKWVSCEESRARVQELRRVADAVVVGSSTFFADNPRLTCRLEGAVKTRPLLAVVVGRRLPDTDGDYYLLKERAKETVFFTGEEEAGSIPALQLGALGCTVVGLPLLGAGLDFRPGFEFLRREMGCFYTLCEGGGRLGMSLALQGLADEMHVFLAPKILGDDSAVSVFSGREVGLMSEALRLRVAHTRKCGDDVHIKFMFQV